MERRPKKAQETRLPARKKVDTEMIKAPRLRPGDTVGIVSPSWGGAGRFPHRLQRGVAHLESLGFRVKIAPHALGQRGYVSDTAANRAADIHALFRDPEIRAIVAAIGGDHSCHLLPLLDWDLIRANPKIFVGYSDISVLNVAIWAQTGLITFNGPAVLPEFAEFPRMYDYTEGHMLRALCRAEPVGQIETSTWWTEEFLDWEQKLDMERPRQRKVSPGWSWLRGGVGEGALIGGCIESLQHLRGTPYWPDWRGAILFFETSEEAPPPQTVDGILMDYENMGVLEQLQGLLVGRPMGYSDGQKAELREVILERTSQCRFPVVADMDFGHTAPQFTLPIGCHARIDGGKRQFAIVEAAVA
jgi:muramoyltetrapeptide carboxypeptidase LdcA involved in peptidoglycan recycling